MVRILKIHYKKLISITLKCFSVLLLLTFLTTFAVAADYQSPSLPLLAHLRSDAEQGDKRSLATLRMHAEAGISAAQCELGEFYRQTGNYSEAEKWYRKAADQGDALSQYNLGYFYATGHHGMKQDEIEAYFWFSLAAANTHGVFSLPDTKPFIEGVRYQAAQKLTRQQRLAVKKRVKAWKPTHQKNLHNRDHLH